MKLYLVRHAQSVDASNHISQSPESKLSLFGRRQASHLARRFKSIPLDLIICSPYIRTRETASEIIKYNQAPLIYSPLFTEVRKPSQAIGQHQDSKFYADIRHQQRQHQDDPFWHYSDEENYFDFKHRVQSGIAFLQFRSEQNILVVTHGFWISMLSALMLFGPDALPSELNRFRNFVNMSNTGISIFEFDEERWKLISWNDTTHNQ